MFQRELYLNELKRLEFLKDVHYSGPKISHILLFREYQFRLFSWKRELKYDGPDYFNKSKDYHNLFIDLSPNWFNEIISEETIINDLKYLGIKNIYSGFRVSQGYLLHLYINWELFKNRPEIQLIAKLKEPYEPVLKIISDGGFIDIVERRFEINFRTYFSNNYFQLPSIKDEFLGYIDANFSNDFADQEKINQLKINQLWEEFNSQRTKR